MNLSIKNGLAAIETALEEFKQFSDQNNISKANSLKHCIVIDELLSNSIKYGSTDDYEHEI